jgi:hypothetical protein
MLEVVLRVECEAPRLSEKPQSNTVLGTRLQ